MNTTTQQTTSDIPNPNDFLSVKVKRHFSALAIDISLWSYTVLVSWKVIYEKVIMNMRYPKFFWTQPLTAFVIGAVIALALYMTSLSCGRAFTKLMKRDETVSYTHLTLPTIE